MARTSSARRHQRDSDPMDSLKPLIVLGLLGTIMYGAYSVVQKGPGAPPTGITFGDAPPADAVHPPQVTFGAAPLEPSTLPADPSAIAPHPLAGAEPLHATPTAAPTAPFPAPPLPNDPPALPPASDIAGAAPAALPAAPLSAATAPAPLAVPPGLAPPDPLPQTPAAALPVLPVATPTADTRRGPPSAAFAGAWAEAHEKLSAGRYAEALSLLSVWYDDPSLGPEESQRLEDLLGQLAGTVIYSQKDLLLPPQVVAPGDTLQSIAAPLQVPWQLLGKINGVPDPTQLVTGEHLKVVHGPFDAVISVSRRRMSLQVGGNYAGSFPVVLGRQVHDRIGQSVAVLDVRRPGIGETAPGFAAQVAYAPATAATSILLGDGLAIEGVEDPSLVAESVSPSSIVVSLRDLEDIADILGSGSQVLVRR